MSMRILIVEDESLVALALEDILRERGHNVIGVADDSVSAASAARRSPDIALVDLNLRDGPTGAGIGRRFAEAGVTVVYLTANPDEVGGRTGALGVVTKPCDDEDIARVVDYAIRRRRGDLTLAPPEPLRLVG
jgi:DNA-binding response OmpR family regulator